MKLFIDSAIPYIKGVLEPYAEVHYKKGSEISTNDVKECDALIVRTRTRCDKTLLAGSRVRFIGTATIGHDHINKEYCRENQIRVETAAGCNALGVVQYVLTAMRELEKIKPIRTVGIVGVGNVGSALSSFLTAAGYTVLENDPPRAAAENNFKNTPLSTLLKESDLVTLHTPFDITTNGLADDAFFANLGEGKFFINASRGEVVNEEALLRAIEKRQVIFPVIDVWCNEPNINKELLEKAFIATPHIAGYSQQGKANGSAMMVEALSSFFNIEELRGWYPEGISKNKDRKITTENYDIIADSRALKEGSDEFEELRNHYNYRKEFF